MQPQYQKIILESNNYLLIIEIWASVKQESPKLKGRWNNWIAWRSRYHDLLTVWTLLALYFFPATGKTKPHRFTATVTPILFPFSTVTRQRSGIAGKLAYCTLALILIILGLKFWFLYIPPNQRFRGFEGSVCLSFWKDFRELIHGNEKNQSVVECWFINEIWGRLRLEIGRQGWTSGIIHVPRLIWIFACLECLLHIQLRT